MLLSRFITIACFVLAASAATTKKTTSRTTSRKTTSTKISSTKTSTKTSSTKRITTTSKRSSTRKSTTITSSPSEIPTSTSEIDTETETSTSESSSSTSESLTSTSFTSSSAPTTIITITTTSSTPVSSTSSSTSVSSTSISVPSTSSTLTTSTTPSSFPSSSSSSSSILTTSIPSTSSSTGIPSTSFSSPAASSTLTTSTTATGIPVTTTPSATVVVPLYIYPSYTAWEPLYTSLAKNPNLKFQVVVNTFNNWSNGTDSSPDVYYITAINTLRGYKNAVPLCYVHTEYMLRPIADVYKDITVCANWKNHITWGSDYHMSGVFFDETAYDYNATTIDYMTNVTTFARTSLGAGNDLVVFNPGRVVPAEWYSLADYVVAFENSYTKYSNATIGWIAPANRARTLLIMYGFTGTVADQLAFVNSIVQAGIGGLFLSTEGVYTAWSTMWQDFCKAMSLA